MSANLSGVRPIEALPRGWKIEAETKEDGSRISMAPSVAGVMAYALVLYRLVTTAPDETGAGDLESRYMWIEIARRKVIEVANGNGTLRSEDGMQELINHALFRVDAEEYLEKESTVGIDEERYFPASEGWSAEPVTVVETVSPRKSTAEIAGMSPFVVEYGEPVTSDAGPEPFRNAPF